MVRKLFMAACKGMGGRRRWLLQPGVSRRSEPARGAADCNTQASQASLRYLLKLISAGLARWSERFSRGPLPVAKYCAAKPRKASLQDGRVGYTGLVALRAARCLLVRPKSASNAEGEFSRRSQDSQVHPSEPPQLPANRTAIASKQEPQSSHCQAAVLDLLELVLFELCLRPLAVACSSSPIICKEVGSDVEPT